VSEGAQQPARAVEVDRVTKRYGTLTAVDAVSLTVPEGSFTTLLGPSGCGKTTLLRIIGGFVTPDSGDVLIEGRSQRGLPAFKRNAGMVFQDFALFPHMSVLQNVGYGLRFQRLDSSVRRERVNRTLAFLQLDGLAERYPHELSGGQQQRVALGRALAVQPQVLLMDEPLSNLDAKLRIRVRAELKSIQRQLGITTIYVTHDQEEALALSDTVAVMSAGRIRQSASPRELYLQPDDRFVADVVGESNFLPVGPARPGRDGWSVELFGQRISVRGSSRPAGAGQDLTLLVRPEWFRVAAAGAVAEAGGAALAARLQERTYHGASEQYWFRLGSGQTVLVELPAVGAPQLAEGDDVTLLLAPGQGVLVHDDS
jgi:ABC-type Fe3+/spermidine/putrescine transport system ATPase subunit